uniref:Uncharacterized protein n=1 Tax=Arundo donax TaxID=35708 RepID=A0A0A9A8Y8_ARUDO
MAGNGAGIRNGICTGWRHGKENMGLAWLAHAGRSQRRGALQKGSCRHAV